MNSRDYFPLGKAVGKAFCNREAERAWLAENLKANKHSLLIAPRRFGKSSLAGKVIAESDTPSVNLNFNICADEGDVEELIREGVAALIAQHIGSIEKAVQLLKKRVKQLTPKISLGTDMAHLELSVERKEQGTPASRVEEALNLAEAFLADKEQSGILVLDEFQAVGLISKGAGVEASIRNAAQSMKHLTLIFSGSHRGLLKLMFEDNSRPLYKLCRKLSVDRIKAAHYQKHLNQAAQEAWGSDLDPAAFDEIMGCTGRHPYYVNYLCDVLWTRCTSVPSLEDVHRSWEQVAEEEEGDTHAEIAQLSLGQRKVLKAVVLGSGTNLLSAEAVKSLGMALSSISGALAGLVEKDVIEKQEQGYMVINPLLQHLLQK